VRTHVCYEQLLPKPLRYHGFLRDRKSGRTCADLAGVGKLALFSLLFELACNATSCAVFEVPVCARIGKGSVLFVGKVTAAKATGRRMYPRESRI
jgi:hypothetical protein